jgi:hypothetical protein
MMFEDAKQAIMQSAIPSGGDNLLGMRMDMDAYLIMRCPSIASVTVTADSNPGRLLTVECIAAAETLATDVSQELQTVWLNDLCYRFRETHRLRQTATTVELDFATQTSDEDGIFVTGTIVVRWANAQS